jgi:predicted TIM-barrel fold metal-dependent hydrolase
MRDIQACCAQEAMAVIDLSAVPVVDNHCHGIYRDQGPLDAATWRQLFTESRDAGTQQEHVTQTLFYRRMVRELAAFLECEPTEEAVLAARGARDGAALVRELLGAAHVEALLIDEGFPGRDLVLPDTEVAALAGCRVAPVLRLEVLMQRLIAEHATLEGVVEGLRAALADVRAGGYVALKSIAAYRTGLNIRRWNLVEAAGGFAAARREVKETGSVRLAHKALLDTLLHVAFAAAARQEVPVQFHTGYGDTDADLLLANPLHLRAVLEDPGYRGMPVVVLHEAYPYTREGAYLSAVYDQVYLDLSYATPFLGYDEMVRFTNAALGVAPSSKLLYSSDAVGVPELHWIGARAGRHALGEALDACVASGELSVSEAEAAGEAVLRGNARRLYGL